jgi:hypothetical protein
MLRREDCGLMSLYVNISRPNDQTASLASVEQITRGLGLLEERRVVDFMTASKADEELCATAIGRLSSSRLSFQRDR